MQRWLEEWRLGYGAGFCFGTGNVWEIGRSKHGSSRVNLIIIHLKSNQNYFFLALPDPVLSRPVERK